MTRRTDAELTLDAALEALRLMLIERDEYRKRFGPLDIDPGAEFPGDWRDAPSYDHITSECAVYDEGRYEPMPRWAEWLVGVVTCVVVTGLIVWGVSLL